MKSKRKYTVSAAVIEANRKKAELVKTHGDWNKPTYGSWKSMMGRCYTKGNGSYKNYGAKGVFVCKRWHKYQNFKLDMGERPEGHTLDRINNKLGYKPSNCKWATPAEQNRNRRGVVYLTWQGQTKIIKDWATHLGISPSRIQKRIESGWNIDRVLSLKDGRLK